MPTCEAFGIESNLTCSKNNDVKKQLNTKEYLDRVTDNQKQVFIKKKK